MVNQYEVEHLKWYILGIHVSNIDFITPPSAQSYCYIDFITPPSAQSYCYIDFITPPSAQSYCYIDFITPHQLRAIGILISLLPHQLRAIGILRYSFIQYGHTNKYLFVWPYWIKLYLKCVEIYFLQTVAKYIHVCKLVMRVIRRISWTPEASQGDAYSDPDLSHILT